MRKLLSAFIIILVLHTTYYDLTTGTLATYKPASTTVVSDPANQKQPYITYKVNAGDTVLSIVEKTNGSIPVSIDTVVDDFKQLNGISPTHIQIGEQYKVPSYKDVESQ
ncbi:LysM peptidoglycan-binding domain-containing protein [Guptibacillus algicola]|uniref:LysM peptidoglycan-binding domain-containing protein n=1 Tax=Guptibacillus algicola TaxID=225844 RepID=UPI001CD39CB7|nr:LysM domain-containing protein [Alkalihalobacillus algicola]MCA0986056.1 LysM peptidoglycan-binding domain-containing protein [Alkalihalobacillus algicola]